MLILFLPIVSADAFFERIDGCHLLLQRNMLIEKMFDFRKDKERPDFLDSMSQASTMTMVSFKFANPRHLNINNFYFLILLLYNFFFLFNFFFNFFLFRIKVDDNEAI